VPDEAIHSFSDGRVEGGFEIGGEAFGPLRADGGFAFLRDEALTVDVGRAGCLLREEALFVFAAVRVLRPKLGLGDRGAAKGFEGIDGGAVGATAFSLDSEAVLGGVIGEEIVVIGDDKVGDGAAEVGEEACAAIAVAYDSAGDDGEPWDGIVAAALGELFGEALGPVGAAELSTVGGEIFEAGR
jgi:hypothetical protein